MKSFYRATVIDLDAKITNYLNGTDKNETANYNDFETFEDASAWASDRSDDWEIYLHSEEGAEFIDERSFLFDFWIKKIEAGEADE